MSVDVAVVFPLRAESVGVRVEDGLISSGNVSFDFPQCDRGFGCPLVAQLDFSVVQKTSAWGSYGVVR